VTVVTSATASGTPLPDAPAVAAPTRALISPAVDMLFIGGASIVVLALMNVMLLPSTPDNRLAWFVFNLSFVVNFPHFLASYQLLYADFGGRVLREPRFFWAAVIVPVILVGVLAAGYLSRSVVVLGYLVNAMFFFVGWHYVKQIFGGITVSNAIQKFFYTRTERTVLKANLFSLWAISFLIPNIGARAYLQDGIPYHSLDLPAWALQVAYVCLAVSGAGVVAVNLRKYVREGRWASPTAIVCYLAIYAWYLPALGHPMFFHMIPFFHSLQYLLFVYVFRRNKVEAHADVRTPAGRARQLTGIWGYLACAALLGGTFMYYLPRYVDGLRLHDPTVVGPTFIYFSCLVFINVHHYFIDNVIWRGSNEEMRQYLFR